MLLAPAAGRAQSASLRGRVVDPASLMPIAGATIRLVNPADTSEIHGASSGAGGAFELTGLSLHAYRLEASRVGYASLRDLPPSCAT